MSKPRNPQMESWIIFSTASFSW